MQFCFRCFTTFIMLGGFCISAAAQESAHYVPIPLDWNTAGQTVFDLSGYLDAPAGKDGNIRIEGEHFVRPDGTRFRPWGVNLDAGAFFLPKEDADKMAKTFARFGFTCVRFHSLDASQRNHLFPNPQNTTEWSAEKLDQFDYFVAQLKKHGIYISFTINAYRIFREDDGVTDYDKIGFGKSTYYFDPKVQEHFFDFARKILTHKNPYTGTEYRHEPALMWVELLNENSIFEAWTFGRLTPSEQNIASSAWKPLTKYYADELLSLWNEWLKKNVPEQKRLDWAKALGSADGKVPFCNGRDGWKHSSNEHFKAELQFFYELEQTFFARAKKFLKEELGMKALLTGDADHSDWISQYAHQIAFNMQGDFMGGHGYWEHADYGPPLTLNQQNPMVNEPLDSTVVQFARTPMKGRPFTINETNTFFPHPFAGEHTPILTAYTLFQDWDGIHWFNWGQGMRSNAGDRVTTLSTSSDPVRYANVILSSIMFHRNDIAPAKKTVVRTMTRETALDSIRWDRSDNRPFFTKGFALSTPLQHKVRWQLVEKNDPALKQKYPEPAPQGLIQSDTEQLAWKNADKKRGVVTINSPATQGAIGFIGGTPERFDDIDIAVENDFAVVVLTSLDGKPVQQAERLLLVTHSDYTSTGFEWDTNKKAVKQLGRQPILIQPVKGTVTLKKLGAKKATVTALTGMGAKTDKSFEATGSGQDWSIALGNNASIWYLIEIER